MTLIDIPDVAEAIRAFDYLTAMDRAAILTAISLAPENPLETDGAHEEYFDSPAYGAWNTASEVYLSPPSYDRNAYYVTLEEAAGYQSAPTKEDIVKALERGRRMVRA